MTASRHIPTEDIADGPDGPICRRFELPAAGGGALPPPPPPTSGPTKRRHHQRSHRSEHTGEVRGTPPPVAHMAYARRGGGCWVCGEPFVYAELVGVTPAGHHVCQACL
jgi:hypothetical protein